MATTGELADATKATVFLPDAAPLIHLAAADALSVLNAMGRVVIPDIVELEATYPEEKPYASEIGAWILRGQQAGSPPLPPKSVVRPSSDA